MSNDLDSLKDNSIRIDGAIEVCWPQYDEEETIDMTNIELSYDGSYSTNNSTICFVDNGVFVTPYTRKAMSIIKDAGLIEKTFYVPFSNWDYPKHEDIKWFHLREAARESYRRDYENDCNEWCDRHGIVELSEDTLKRCFRMPSSGVPVRHPILGGREEIYFPACGETSVDSVVIDKLGCYSISNGIIVFVYRDGHTYVTVNRKELNDELDLSGYRKAELFVPFSRDEEITDPHLAALWEQAF